MKPRSSPLIAAASALALCVQSTGAASIPAAMLPSAAFPPPAARFGAFPAPRHVEKTSSGPSWLDSARIVSDYVFARAHESSNPTPPVALPADNPREAAPVAAPVEPAPVVTPLNPGVDSPRDRMMVVMEPGRRVEAVIDNNFREPAAPAMSSVPFPRRILPPFRENALKGGGLRARLAYIGAHGMISGHPDGYTLSFPGAAPRLSPSPSIPEAYQRDFPIYFPGEEVEISMTVENRSAATLTGVRLEAVQEVFRPSGSEGVRVLPPKTIPVAASLAPGEQVVVHWRTKLLGPADKPVNLEQTHVRITADGRAEALIDAPQAGVVDPPGPGLL